MDYISTEDKVLGDIDVALYCGRYREAIKHISRYENSFGKLNPKKEFAFVESIGDIYASDTIVSRKTLLGDQTSLTELFLSEVSKGSMTEDEALAYEVGHLIQEELLKAYKMGDVLSFHEIITKYKATPDYVFCNRSLEGCFTLWEKVQYHSDNIFYKYFVKNLSHLPCVKEHLKRETAIKALTC